MDSEIVSNSNKPNIQIDNLVRQMTDDEYENFTNESFTFSPVEENE